MLLVKRRDKNRSRFAIGSNIEHIGVLGLEVLVETNMFLFGRLAQLIINYQFKSDGFQSIFCTLSIQFIILYNYAINSIII